MALPGGNAQEEERTIVCVDEAGFSQLPFVARTYAPVGQTPVLRAPLARDHLSVISGVTAAGRLFTHIQEEAFCGAHVVVFLRQLLRQIPGKLLVIWDGATIHRCQAVTDFLKAGAAHRLHLERLPGYAPDLNPDEGVWNVLTCQELTNRWCKDLEELRWELRLAIRRLQHGPHRLIACVRECGYV